MYKISIKAEKGRKKYRKALRFMSWASACDFCARVGIRPKAIKVGGTA